MEQTKEMVRTDNKNWDEALKNENWVAPVVDIHETDDEYIMTANMPGVNKDNIQTNLEDGNLVIMGRINFDEARNRKYVLRENVVANYYRKFRISDNIDAEKINAKFENGQLIVTLPKHERVKPKTIEIN